MKVFICVLGTATLFAGGGMEQIEMQGGKVQVLMFGLAETCGVQERAWL